MPDRPRIAYAIASHTLPHQALRLATTLRRGSPAASIVWHHDSRRCEVDRVAVEQIGAHLLEPPSIANWGEVSLVAMVLRCLRWCLHHTDFEWLVLLSGQDYPIRPLATIEQSLVGAEADAFIEAVPCDRPGLRAPIDEFAGRYYFRWQHASSEFLWKLARATPGRGRLVRTRELPSGRWIGLRGLRSPFGPDLRCQRGSDWFTLSRPAVAALDAFDQRRPDVLRYYSRTIHPSESFIQTALANDSSIRVSPDCRRYTVWDTPNQTSPRVLRLDDLGAALASGCDFARKFDPTVDRAVLDQLDRRVHAA